MPPTEEEEPTFTEGQLIGIYGTNGFKVVRSTATKRYGVFLPIPVDCRRFYGDTAPEGLIKASNKLFEGMKTERKQHPITLKGVPGVVYWFKDLITDNDELFKEIGRLMKDDPHQTLEKEAWWKASKSLGELDISIMVADMTNETFNAVKAAEFKT
jgi:hypothetical protein